MNWHTLLFYLMAFITCGFALAVVLTANIVRMAIYLVASLTAVAGLFFLAGANFVGATQLMIYVGGTLVLIVFGVMLTARGPLAPPLHADGGSWIVATVIGASLLAILLQAALSVKDWTHPPTAENPTVSATPQELGMGLLGVRVDREEQTDPALQQVLQQGMSGYLLPFEIISIHLVVVLVGAAYLARAKRRNLLKT